jgi:hypothetical protein
MSEADLNPANSNANPAVAAPGVERGELIIPEGGDVEGDDGKEVISEPAKVMRIGSMIKQLLDEVHNTELDEPGRERLRDIYRRSIEELGSALSPDLRDELERLAPLFDGSTTPSDVELKIAQAQLVGWLEGLFHGIQATLFAQQMVARQQLENMRGQLTQGGGPAEPAAGTYL